MAATDCHRKRMSMKKLVIVALLACSAWAQQPIEVPFVPGAAPVKLMLPEGYSLRAVEGAEGNWVFCPWNEYFNVSTARFQRTTKTAIKDEAAMKAELAAFVQANSSMKFQVEQVIATPKGPYGWLEAVTGVKPKESVSCSLMVPHKDELLVFTTVGSLSSLADQKVIRDLFIREVSK